jgi:hypothetical protein
LPGLCQAAFHQKDVQAFSGDVRMVFHNFRAGL